MTPGERDRIKNQYLADQQDGFVSNIISYIEHTYGDRPKAELIEIRKIILNAYST